MSYPYLRSVAVASFIGMGAILLESTVAQDALAQVDQPAQTQLPSTEPMNPEPELSTDEGPMQGDSIGGAAQVQPAPSPFWSSETLDAGYERTLQSLDGQFQQIADQTDAMIQEGSNENPALEERMYSYAETMNEAFQQALEDAKLAADTEGKEGNGANLGAFEKLAQGHAAQLQQLGERAGAIAINSEDNLHGPTGGPRNPAEDWSDKQDSVLSALSGLFISQAEARVAAQCVAPCASQNWGACMSCVVSAGPEAVRAWNEFVSCWREAAGFWGRFSCLRDLIITFA